MAPKPDYGTKLKELKDLVQATNTKITSLEEPITSNHDDLKTARITNNEIRSNDTLNIAKNKEIIINHILKKPESLKKEPNTKIPKITQKVKKDLHQH